MADRNGIVFVAAMLQNYDILPEEGASTPVHIEYDDGVLWSVDMNIVQSLQLTYSTVNPRI
jgi:hypothetical protein